MYCHYQIKNKETNKSLYSAYNHACFSTFTSLGFDDTKQGFAKGRYMEIYSPVVSNKLTEEQISQFCKDMTKFGLPIKLSITEKVEELPSLICPAYVFTIDFDKHKNKCFVKLAQYIVRHVYEDQMYQSILSAYRLKNKYPKYSFVQLFFYAVMYRPGGGHPFYFSQHKLVKAADFKAFLKTFEDRKYDDKEINVFQAHFKRDFNMDINPSEDNFEKFMKEYKEKIKK